jgi:hypothetical protein
MNRFVSVRTTMLVMGALALLSGAAIAQPLPWPLFRLRCIPIAP